MDSDKRVYLFDSTLRDGAQTQGVDFGVADKVAIARALDRIGLRTAGDRCAELPAQTVRSDRPDPRGFYELVFWLAGKVEQRVVADDAVGRNPSAPGFAIPKHIQLPQNRQAAAVKFSGALHGEKRHLRGIGWRVMDLLEPEAFLDGPGCPSEFVEFFPLDPAEFKQVIDIVDRVVQCLVG